jgi:hypothetical protein
MVLVDLAAVEARLFLLVELLKLSTLQEGISMPIDPQSLEAIRNPTANLNIAQSYLKGVQLKEAREDRELKREEFRIKKDAAIRDEGRKIEKRDEERTAFELKQKQNLLKYSASQRDENLAESISVNNYIEQFKIDAQNNPELLSDPDALNTYKTDMLNFVSDPDVKKLISRVDPSQYPAVQQSAQFAIKTYSEASQDEQFGEFQKIPGTELYGQPSSKTGKYANVRSGVDGKSEQGNSEFERGIQRGLDQGYFTEDQATELRKKRTAVLSGTEMREGAIQRLDEKQTDRYNKETKALREEYTEGSKHFGNMSTNIEGALAAIDSGDTRLSEVLLNNSMLQVQDTKTRAYQMYTQFDQEFGHLGQRIVGQVSRFLEGTRTQRETDEIKSVLSHFKENYVDPAGSKLRDRYRQFAIQQGKEPFTVVPPNTPEDIKSTTLLDKKEKIEMIKKFFPDWKPK